MKYRLIGIDLDGTLLNSRGRISDANRAAIAAAQDAGVLVVPCTGRGWREAYLPLRDVPSLELGVFITGAMVAEIATGQSVDFAVIEPHLALALVEQLRREPEAVLVYREPALAGHDYLVTGEGELTANTEWWFQATGANVHFQRHVTADDLHHALRVGMVASGERLPTLSQQVEQAFH
ncbi:MAG: HAD family hydrolase, partial [Phycisphaeraceae bacterium]